MHIFGTKHPLTIQRWYMDNDLRVKETVNMYINIYPGIDNNELIILKEKGNIIDEKNKGDIKVFVNIENNTEFKRKGLDLIYKKTITLKQALTGFSFNIRHLSGKTYNINNSDGSLININYKKKIENMGMKRDDETGLLVIEFKIIFPEKLSKTQMEKIKEIL